MDKYQKLLMMGHSFFGSTMMDDKPHQDSIYKDGIITVEQVDDITITKYKIIAGGIFQSMSAIKGEQVIPLECADKDGVRSYFTHILDFEDKIDSIKVEFKYQLAEPLVIDIKYIDANKDTYYQKLKDEQLKALIAKANIKHATGSNLVNIYFQPCCENVEQTRIALYLKTNGNPQLLAIYDVEKTIFYKSISGLAYGTYLYQVGQYDKAQNIIIASDFYEFTISDPNSASRKGVAPNRSNNNLTIRPR